MSNKKTPPLKRGYVLLCTPSETNLSEGNLTDEITNSSHNKNYYLVYHSFINILLSRIEYLIPSLTFFVWITNILVKFYHRFNY